MILYLVDRSLAERLEELLGRGRSFLVQIVVLINLISVIPRLPSAFGPVMKFLGETDKHSRKKQ